jgi:hypothetical protein
MGASVRHGCLAVIDVLSAQRPHLVVPLVDDLVEAAPRRLCAEAEVVGRHRHLRAATAAPAVAVVACGRSRVRERHKSDYGVPLAERLMFALSKPV